MTDTHTHLYDEAFAGDMFETVQRAIDKGVTKMCLPNCNKDSIAPMMTLVRQFPEHCFPMMGIHPCDIKEDYKEQLASAKSWLDKAKFIAVGEIGLDFYESAAYKEQQLEAFRTQIDWAIEKHLPVSIHARKATSEAIEIVREKQTTGTLKGVFHCFEGDEKQAAQIAGLGFCLGIGGVVTFKNTHLREILKTVDLKNIVFETDAPYLAPVPYRGKRNESSYIPIIAQTVADVKEVSLAVAMEITDENALSIFGI